MEKMKAGLPKGVNYRQLRHIRLVGIMLTVYVRESLVPLVSDVHVGCISTGIMGMLGMCVFYLHLYWTLNVTCL